jgi:hypothetical protein
MLFFMASPLPAFVQWANFYVVVGSSAGALTGLQFVVMTLVAGARAAGSMREIRAFGTPTVVEFCTALLVSAAMCAPWNTLFHPGLCLAVFGAAGFIYSLNVIRHARKQTGYAADSEDWFWYVALPLAAYAALAGEGVLMAWNLRGSTFLIGATTLVFLFIGIHNSWDTVTYVAVRHGSRHDRPRE